MIRMMQLGACFVDLGRVQRHSERRADVGRRERVPERDPPRHARRLAEAAAGEQAPEAPDDVAERDPRREDVAGRPQRQADAPDVDQRDDDGEDQAAVEDPARPRQRQQLARVRDEHLGVGQEQQQLGADEGADDDVDAEVEDAVGVEASCFRPHHRQLQAEQIRRRQQDAVGVDGDRTELKQSWIHACLRSAYRESSSPRRPRWPSRQR